MSYSNGYQDKIDFYTYKVNRAIRELNTTNLDFYSKKLAYFMNRQAELNRQHLIFGQLPA